MSNARVNYDHLWFERLQELSQYRPVLDKLLRGCSLGTVTDFIMEQTDRGPFSNLNRSTVCTFLNALDIWIKENARESMKKECTRRAPQLMPLIGDFTSGMTQGADIAAQQPGITEEEIKDLQSQHMSSMVDEITSDGLVRLMLKMHLPHIDRLKEWEKQSQEPSKDWDRSMQVLLSAAVVLQRNESVQRLFDAQVQARCPIPEPQLSEEAQRIAELTNVDQNLIREAGEKLKIYLKRKMEEEYNRLKLC